MVDYTLPGVVRCQVNDEFSWLIYVLEASFRFQEKMGMKWNFGDLKFWLYL